MNYFFNLEIYLIKRMRTKIKIKFLNLKNEKFPIIIILKNVFDSLQIVANEYN